MRTAGALLRLTRPTTTALIFLSVFLPTLARNREITESLLAALPALFIAMCTFILNDIDDFEADKINHPDRPLPSGRLLLPSVTGFYFLCLALAVLWTKTFVSGRASFLYYTLLFVVINYKYVEAHFPNWKASYVASASSFPVLIVIALTAQSAMLHLVALATFLFVLGRELLLDYVDRAGDPESFVTAISFRRVTMLAFTAQVLGLIALVPLAGTAKDVSMVFMFAILSAASLTSWLAGRGKGVATDIMKVQMYIGIYFLL